MEYPGTARDETGRCRDRGHGWRLGFGRCYSTTLRGKRGQSSCVGYESGYFFRESWVQLGEILFFLNETMKVKSSVFFVHVVWVCVVINGVSLFLFFL